MRFLQPIALAVTATAALSACQEDTLFDPGSDEYLEQVYAPPFLKGPLSDDGQCNLPVQDEIQLIGGNICNDLDDCANGIIALDGESTVPELGERDMLFLNEAGEGTEDCGGPRFIVESSSLDQYLVRFSDSEQTYCAEGVGFCWPAEQFERVVLSTTPE